MWMCVWGWGGYEYTGGVFSSRSVKGEPSRQRRRLIRRRQGACLCVLAKQRQWMGRDARCGAAAMFILPGTGIIRTVRKFIAFVGRTTCRSDLRSMKKKGKIREHTSQAYISRTNIIFK
jgi:hypothetical protein